MRIRLVVLTFAVLALLTVAVTGVVAGNDGSRARATLTGYQEVPTVSSMGRGEFRATIDDGAQVINYSLTLGGTFNSPPFVAHIHLGQRGVNGGVSAFLCGGGGKPACNASGTVTGTITPADVIGPVPQGIAAGEWAELVAAIRAGVTYANAHSAAQPGGEIRGQVKANDDDDDDD